MADPNFIQQAMAMMPMMMQQRQGGAGIYLYFCFLFMFCKSWCNATNDTTDDAINDVGF